MATVSGITAAKMQEYVDENIVSGYVNTMGSLILVTRSGTEIDAGPVMDPLLPGAITQYYRGDKTWQTLHKNNVAGLENVNNTSDDNKPASLPQKAWFVAKWKPNNLYFIGDQIVSPNNEVVTALQGHTSTSTYDITKWSGVPFGHMGKTSNFQQVTSGGSVVTMEAAQILRGGMTFDNATDSLVVPTSGLYEITIRPYLTGSQNYTGGGKAQRNLVDLHGTNTMAWKAGAADYAWGSNVTQQLSANDKINMVVSCSDNIGSTWGTTGFDGAYIEVKFVSS